MSGTVNSVFSRRIESKSLHLVSVHSFPSAIKSILLDLRDKDYPSSMFWGLDEDQLKKIDTAFSSHLVMSLRPVRSSRIEDVFTWHRPIASSRIYESLQPYSHSRLGSGGRSISLFSSWHFLADIKSEIHLKALLKEHIDDFIAKQAA